MPVRLPYSLDRIVTPLSWEAWQANLVHHPDRAFANWLVAGIRGGFRIGYDYTLGRPKSSQRNLASALEKPQVIREYLAKECAEGRIMGPFAMTELSQLHISRFGVVPKSTPGKWRLILDLSSPKGHSVNDGISEACCSLSYVSVEDAVEAVMKKGRGASLAKVDIRNAYRVLPVHPDDRWLLGMRWEGALYVDTTLPFGLRSAPKIFTGVADAVEWSAKREGVDSVLHYLDNYLVVGRPESDECAYFLSTLTSLCDRLGLPIALEKLEGPACVLTFLGIEIDTLNMQLRLPHAKLLELRALIRSWLGRKACSRRELQSLTGKLQHACKVVKPGRSFLRRMFELLRGIGKAHHQVRLNHSFRSDLVWWDAFLESWNGVSFLQPAECGTPDQHLFTDAAGSFGCGGLWNGHWFQYRWSDAFRMERIPQQELLPIVIACMLWGRQWHGQHIRCHCDNVAVVQVVNSGYSTDKQMMRLIRCLFFVTAHWQLLVRAVHIAGDKNTAADAVSRGNMDIFFQVVPDACQSPTTIPSAVLGLLVEQQPDWLSPAWAQLFRSYLQQA